MKTYRGSGGVRGCIQKFADWIDNEIYAYNNKHLLRSNTKDYGGKTHQTDSQNSDTTASSARELNHLQFSFQAACPETFGYTLVASLTSALDGGEQSALRPGKDPPVPTG
jgi:hypothetical protein